MARTTKIAIALGGGAALGFAHVGILRVLEKEQVPLDLITGTSMGALIGAMYAVEPSADEVEARLVRYFGGPQFRQIRFDFLKGKRREAKAGFWANFSTSVRKSLFYGMSLTKQSFLSRERYLANIDELVPDMDASKTKIPFAAVAGDLVSGRKRLLTHGPLRAIVAGSCSIPGLFPPVPWNDALLIDGSWVNSLPVEEARALGADLVIGVRVDALVHESADFQNSLDVLIRAGDMSRRYLPVGETPDVLIPIETTDIHWAEWSRVETMIARGEEAARRAVEEIRRVTRPKGLRGLFG